MGGINDNIQDDLADIAGKARKVRQVWIKVSHHISDVFPLVAGDGNGAFNYFVEINANFVLTTWMGKFFNPFFNHNCVGNGEPLAGAAADFFGGEKWVEDFAPYGFGNAGSGICNGNDNFTVVGGRALVFDNLNLAGQPGADPRREGIVMGDPAIEPMQGLPPVRPQYRNLDGVSHREQFDIGLLHAKGVIFECFWNWNPEMLA